MSEIAQLYGLYVYSIHLPSLSKILFASEYPKFFVLSNSAKPLFSRRSILCESTLHRKVSFQSYHFHVASLRHDSFKSCWKSLRSSCVAALNSGSLNWCALVTSNERSTCGSIMHDKCSTPFYGAGLVRSNRHNISTKRIKEQQNSIRKNLDPLIPVIIRAVSVYR